MNLYAKYGPLLYTYHTRWKNIKYVFRSTFLDIGFGLASLVYLYLINIISLPTFIIAATLFICLFYVYYIFYEIGYIHNDIIIIKKEKKPTLRVPEKLSNTFITRNILLRLIIISIVVFLLSYFNAQLALFYSIILGSTAIIFFLHNIIRNYFWNFITFLGLRIMKFSLIIPILRYVLQTWDNPIYFYMMVLFLLMQFGLNLKVYNKYYGGIMKFPETLMLLYMFISCGVFGGFTHDVFFVYYGTIYLILFILETPKSYFTLKNTR